MLGVGTEHLGDIPGHYQHDDVERQGNPAGLGIIRHDIVALLHHRTQQHQRKQHSGDFLANALKFQGKTFGITAHSEADEHRYGDDQEHADSGFSDGNLPGRSRADKIAMGKLNKFITDNTLLNQEWIMEPKKKVKDVLKEVGGNEKIEIIKFTRFKVGEGI